MLLRKFISAVVCMLLAHFSALASNNVSAYNVMWNSQSANSSESMPCGGGDIGLNVWVENGDILFYMARSGTFDENNSMLKLGRVRVKLSPNPFVGGDFKQELNLEKGYVTISGTGNENTTQVLLWVDVFSPVVHVEVESKQKTEMRVFYENWRYEDRVLEKYESFQNSYKWAAPKGLETKKDVIDFTKNGVQFYHRNIGESIFDVCVKQQKMESVKEQLWNPIKDLTFGGKIIGENLIVQEVSKGQYLQSPYKAWELKSETPVKKQSFQVYLHSGQYPNVIDWKNDMNTFASSYKKTTKKAWAKTKAWWTQYWNRSYVYIQAKNKIDSVAEWQVGRNYQLFRYMLGCNAFGKYPTKFNGGLFTYDPIFTNEKRAFSPDFRNWGGGTFTAQNQRLVYFPMLKSGDFDMMKPQLDFYTRMLKNAELRSKVYWGHDGACFVEQIENFGLANPSEYNWKRPDDYEPGMMYNAWLEYQWDTSLEICWMALQLHTFKGQDISEYMPLIESCLTFFDEHYQYLAKKRGAKTFDQNGHLVLYPGSACETYKMAYNATSTIIALKKVTEGLLALPQKYIDDAQRTQWQGFYERIPPISFQEFGGYKTIAPAKMWERVNNTEAPQLYPVYPWEVYGVGKPDLDIAINTYEKDTDVVKFKSHKSWKQYNIFAAKLGLTKEAANQTILKLQDSDRRFPAFWGPGFDWVPDHNWGGSGMIGVQEMLLQTNGDSIYLFPAWPAEWDVHFKLHAPQNTIVEAQVSGGKVEILNVQPESRKKDIVLMFNKND